MDIYLIRSLCKDETIEITNHFYERCLKRNITIMKQKKQL